MTEYIEREALLDALCYADAITMGGIAIINQFPAADVSPVKRGRWISVDDGKTIVRIINGVPRYSCKCSVCGDWLVASDEYDIKGNFCPNCGAMMEDK